MSLVSFITEAWLDRSDVRRTELLLLFGSDRKLEGKSAYITMWARDKGKSCRHARPIVHLTVAAWRRAHGLLNKRSAGIIASTTGWLSDGRKAHRPSLKRWGGWWAGVKGYGWKKQQWWETVTAQWAWHVDWTHSVRPARSSQAPKWDPLPIHERQTPWQRACQTARDGCMYSIAAPRCSWTGLHVKSARTKSSNWPDAAPEIVMGKR